MQSRLGPGILTLLKFSLVLILVSQVVRGYPRQPKDKSDSSASYESSESAEQNDQPRSHWSPQHASNDSRRGEQTVLQVRRSEDPDQTVRLAERALQNREFPDAGNFSANRESPRAVSTDGSRYQNTQVPHSRGLTQGQRVPAENQRAASTQHLPLSDDAIVFPTDSPMPNHTKYNLKNVPTCQGSTFCETVDNYPERLVTEVIRANDSIKYLGIVDEVPDVVQRFDVADDDVLLCVSNEQIVYPKTAENKQKEWLFIANQKDLKQGVRIETCVNENSECNVVTGLAEGYVMTCKQKYIYRQLIAIHDNNTLAPEMFRFPSSCCCHAKFTGNALTRIGVSSWTKNPITPVRTRRRK